MSTAPGGGPGRSPTVQDVWLRNLITRLWREAAKFGVIGLVNFLLDLGLFNLFLHTILSNRTITAGILSSTVATVSSYFMNRHWTWRDRSRTGLRRELPLFAVLSAVGIGISTACLAFSTYALGLDSTLAKNVSKNGFGLVLGMVWRFWSFKKWVFLAPPSGREPTPLEDAVRTTV